MTVTNAFRGSKKYQYYTVCLPYVGIFECQFVECDGYKSIRFITLVKHTFLLSRMKKNGTICPKTNIFRKSLILAFQCGGHLGFGG